MLQKMDNILSGKKNYTDPVPWNIKDIFKLFLFSLLFLVLSALFGALVGLSYLFIPVIKKFIPLSSVGSIAGSIVTIVSIFVYYYIIKTWILKKYDRGMKILLESRNNKALFIIAIVLGACMGFPILSLDNYEIRRNFLLMPMFPFLLKFIGAILFAPIVEEVLYRSLIYRALKKKIGVTASIFITTIIFTSIHWESYFHPELLIPIFVFGFVINLFYEKTGSLYGCILAHSIRNLVFGITLRFFPV